MWHSDKLQRWANVTTTQHHHGGGGCPFAVMDMGKKLKNYLDNVFPRAYTIGEGGARRPPLHHHKPKPQNTTPPTERKETP